jgi:hypothetical protein
MLFYRLYLNRTKYTFLFEHVESDQVAARIELDVTPHQPVQIIVHDLNASLMTHTELNDLVQLAADESRLSSEAWAMTREYYAMNASGTLPKHEEYGQELFHCDVDSIADLC